MSEEQGIDKKEMIDYLKLLIGSRHPITQHLEVSAWAAVIFYLGGLFVIAKYLLDCHCYNNWILGLISFSIVLICSVVHIFIHAQYGTHCSNRYEYGASVKSVFQLLNNNIKLTQENCKVKDKTHYPIFLQNEIDKDIQEAHAFKNIGHHVIYCWFCKKVINKTFAKYGKIQLIESSLYNLVIVPTFFVLLLLWLQL